MRLAVLLGIAGVGSACKPAANSAPHPPVSTAIVSQLAAARIDAAKTELQQQRPGEALALLVSALRADPASEEARSLAETILRETAWNFPALTIDHGQPIEHLAFAAPSTLWVSLGGENNTTVRWNLDSLKIESVLFPTANCVTRSLTFDAGRRWVVVERGPVTLLCDAQTLKPIRDLGALPDFLTPSAVVVFSADGLLLAHPGFVSEGDHSIVWHLRDAASGEIIRSSEPLLRDAPQPLAAWLDRAQLRVIHSDGSLMEMPLSPIEEIRRTPPQEPVKLLQAQFASDGNSTLVLQSRGPHEPAVKSVISLTGNDDGSLTADSLAQRFPWSRQPNIWTWLPGGVDGNAVKIPTRPHAPVEVGSPLTAVAIQEQSVITGEANGSLSVHRLIPLPRTKSVEREPAAIPTAFLTDLEKLAEGLSGKRYDEQARTFVPLPTEVRAGAFNEFKLDAILSIFPCLDFAEVSAAIDSIRYQAAGEEAFQTLRERLARTDSAAASAFALALKSDRPESIAASLSSAENLPPLLRQIALSRIAWLEGRKADALSGWPEIFPVLAEVRLREDWDGWEQADFQPALENIRRCVSDELAAIEVPESSTPEQRKAIAERLADPATVAAVGKRRFAEALLKAALAFSAHKEETEATFQLANRARDLGAAPEPCLRAEALALTALGDYQKAHPRWIELITEHPVETTLPGDYAEAAYTAFENSDPGQAMEILTTGMHRFPQDGNFALRAGWVALLTGNSERAYQFLQAGRRIGFPQEKLENAIALLTISAAQTGAADDASVYFQELIRLDPAWAEATTIDTLNWPEELKATLWQFVR